MILDAEVIPDPAAAATAGSLVPPRPNLGPEPMSEPIGYGPAGVLIPPAFAIGLLAFAWARARGRGHRQAPGERPGSIADPPQDPIILWADRVRRALADRLGPAWSAKTTEEIAGEFDLEAVIGPERRTFLLRLLAEADRRKFAGSTGLDSEDLPPDRPALQLSPFDPETDDWAAWASGLLANLESPAPAGTRSTKKGR